MRTVAAEPLRVPADEVRAAEVSGRFDPLSWLILLGIVGGSLGATIALAPHLGLPLTTTLVTLGGLAAIAVGERVRPYEPDWLRAHDDVGTDVLHAALSNVGTKRLVDAVMLGSAVALAGALGPWLRLASWPTTWPVPAQLALALCVVEFVQYWLHRYEHEWSDWLWRAHATHHSAPRLYWLNAARLHPIDTALLYLTAYVPLLVLGCPQLVIALFTVFDAVFGVVQHCNIRLALGPLNYLLSGPELHRWHHSRRLEEANANYGSNLIVWDVVFRTYFLPRDRRPPLDIGVAGMPAFPRDYLGQMLSPLRWKSLVPPAAGRA
jgi:sterol desaturase/sphingolipid hydroxylase (fatty acid hydroxylase superfamily)